MKTQTLWALSLIGLSLPTAAAQPATSRIVSAANQFLSTLNAKQRQTGISAYLVNCLVPRDKDIQVISQSRNGQQSFYQLEYLEAGGASSPTGQFLYWFRGVASMFHLGMRHIAEGTDHLLFLLVLLLPAPLMVFGSRWAGFAGARHSVLQILRVVTAFTLGHSITLMAAAFGLVHVPAPPIEVLIAVSILVSAAHALRPLFPGVRLESRLSSA